MIFYQKYFLQQNGLKAFSFSCDDYLLVGQAAWLNNFRFKGYILKMYSNLCPNTNNVVTTGEVDGMV